jgi:hypothetical protein
VAKDQACKLQILSVKHPDLLQVVDKMFDKYATVPQVRRMLERNYHEDVGETAVSTYKKNHYNVHKRMIREQKAAMEAVVEIIGEDGLDIAVNALLWESLQEMTAAQLMAFKKICNDSAKVALMKKQFALYAQEHRLRMQERRDSMKDNTVVVEDFEAARRMVEQAKEIFGIGTRPIAPPVRKLLGAPEETPSAEVHVGAGKENAREIRMMNSEL